MQKPFKIIFMFITDLKVYDISKKALINRDLESSKRLAKLEEMSELIACLLLNP